MVLSNLDWRASFFIAKFEQVIPKQFDWMLRTVLAVAAIHGINRTVFVAPPADPFRMCGMYWKLLGHYFCHLRSLHITDRFVMRTIYA